MRREVVLLAGPPGAGKTTRARALAEQRGLHVYDRDDAIWVGEQQFRMALAELGRQADARAVVIRACASRSAWLKVADLIQPTSTELLSPGADVCRARIAHDNRQYTGATWRDHASRLAGVRTWYRHHDADPWSVPAPILAPSRRW